MASRLSTSDRKRAVDDDRVAVLYGLPSQAYEKLVEVLSEHPPYDCGKLEIPSVIQDVSWRQYQVLLEAFGDLSLPHTYDRGTLEILMSPRKDHDWVKKLVARMIEAASLDLDIGIQSIGSTTLGREDSRRGLQPDECYYFANEALVRGKETLDLNTDPPPDLALEIDVTSSSLPRLPVFAKIGVPEVWRWDGKKLTFLRRAGTGEYRSTARSFAFPFLRPADIERFLKMKQTQTENSIIRAFVDWARAASKKTPNGRT